MFNDYSTWGFNFIFSGATIWKGKKKKPFHLLFGNENIRLLNTDFTLILMAHIYPLGCDPWKCKWDTLIVFSLPSQQYFSLQWWKRNRINYQKHPDNYVRKLWNICAHYVPWEFLLEHLCTRRHLSTHFYLYHLKIHILGRRNYLQLFFKLCERDT